MSTNITNTSPYLRTTRNFPTDIDQLIVEINRAYLDTASFLNDRTIGLFPNNVSALNGEAWFVSSNRRQQGLRQIYQFSDSNLTIDHGLNFSSLTNFTRIWGTFYDGTYWQSLPYVDVVSADNQIGVKVSSTQIIITKGGGSPPTVSNGIVILEWISN